MRHICSGEDVCGLVVKNEKGEVVSGKPIMEYCFECGDPVLINTQQEHDRYFTSGLCLQCEADALNEMYEGGEDELHGER